MTAPEAAFGAARAALAGPFAWGARDCLTASCDAFAALHGRDPLEGRRDLYAGPLGALRIARAAGGYLAWCEQVFAKAGLVRVAAPAAGDLAFLGEGGPFGGVLGLGLGPGLVAVKARGEGMALVARAAVAGWSWRAF